MNPAKFIGALSLALSVTGMATAATLSPLETLGEKLFFDSSLSNPPGQSCADCHTPATGWVGADPLINAAGAVNPGVVFTRFGNRKPPTSAYAGYTPMLHKRGDMGGGGMGGGGMGGGGMGGGGMMEPGTFAGGLFWDGRATGWSLGDPLAEQAMGPFLNPLEQNNPNAKHVCLNVLRTDYAPLFEEVWGPGSLDCVKDVDGTYERIARSIAAYERSTEVNPFSSKFDLFWNNSVGKTPPIHAINMMNWTRFRGRGFDDMELRGLMLFNSKGNCSTCHPLQPMNGSPAPLLTDFGYHNLGVPSNPLNPFYTMPRPWNPQGKNWVDAGLGGFLATTSARTDAEGISRDYVNDATANIGKHRTPSLRNVDLRPDPNFIKAYGHNGYFKSLAEIVHFYNLRDVLPLCQVGETPGMTCFEAPEVADNINRTALGNLKLTPEEGMAIIGFMRTLTDGFIQP